MRGTAGTVALILLFSSPLRAQTPYTIRVTDGAQTGTVSTLHLSGGSLTITGRTAQIGITGGGGDLSPVWASNYLNQTQVDARVALGTNGMASTNWVLSLGYLAAESDPAFGAWSNTWHLTVASALTNVTSAVDGLGFHGNTLTGTVSGADFVFGNTNAPAGTVWTNGATVLVGTNTAAGGSVITNVPFGNISASASGTLNLLPNGPAMTYASFGTTNRLFPTFSLAPFPATTNGWVWQAIGHYNPPLVTKITCTNGVLALGYSSPDYGGFMWLGTNAPPAPWTATTAIPGVLAWTGTGEFVTVGLGVINTNGGRLELAAIQNGLWEHVYCLTATNSINTVQNWKRIHATVPIFLRFRDDGTNFISYLSINGGLTWQTVASRSRTAWLTNHTHIILATTAARHGLGTGIGTTFLGFSLTQP